jgi:predicted DNA-binding protein (UPF0251 family)
MKNPRAGRPLQSRSVEEIPSITCFLPDGVPAARLQNVVLSVDELEAMRLADLEGMYHADAAEKMKVSRQTFGRIIKSARKKVADALTGGKSICIRGGKIEGCCLAGHSECPEFCICTKCGFEQPHVPGLPCWMMVCPHCNIPLARKGK